MAGKPLSQPRGSIQGFPERTLFSTRLKILELLKQPGCCSVPAVGNQKAGMCVCDLTGPLGLTQPTVTHHLKVLREAGLVECEKIGAWLYCQINGKAIKELGAALARV